MSESRQRIVSAAYELFQGNSFHVVGIAEICARAGVNKGTFYHFFPSKIALLVELLETFVYDVIVEYDAVTRESVAAQEKMRLIFQVPRCRNANWKNIHGVTAGCFIGNICLELAAREPVIREKTDWAFKTLSRSLEPIVSELLAEAGRSTSEAQLEAEMVMGMMQGAQVMAKAKNDPEVFDEYLERVLQLLRQRRSVPCVGELAVASG